MKLQVLCILSLLSVCSAEDLIFFADDHYKAVGAPELLASASNPVIDCKDDCVLSVTLSNNGLIEELIPTQGNGSDEDIAKEMQEEMHSIDALNITASLGGRGQVNVISGPCVVTSLPSGEAAEIEFNLSVAGADGWYELPLTLDYEHQVDVTVANGSVSPLYGLDSRLLKVRVFVRGADRLSVEGVKSDLHQGDKGTILAAIKNCRPEIFHNCTARLMAVHPFASSGDVRLGDMAPGKIAVAQFAVDVDENASLRDYSLACELNYDGGSEAIQIPVSFKAASNHLIYILMLIILVIAAAGAAWTRRQHRPRRRKFSR